MKKDQQVMSAIMSIVAVAVLVIPVMTGYLAEQQKETIIFTLPESEYSGVEFIPSCPVNVSAFEDVLGDSLYNESDGDTVLQEGGYPIKWGYTDACIVSGDNNTALINYSLVPDADIEYMYIGLDLTNLELAEKDFMIFDTDMDISSLTFGGIAVYTPYGFNWLTTPTETSAGRYVIPIATYTKQDLIDYASNYGEDIVYLAFDIWDEDTADSSFTFTVSINDIPETLYSWDDFQLFSLSIAVSLVITIATIIFSTDAIDIQFDRRRGRK